MQTGNKKVKEEWGIWSEDKGRTLVIKTIERRWP
jgi:hypothetical protein